MIQASKPSKANARAIQAPPKPKGKPKPTEAKQFAKEMLSNKYKVVAGTLLGADQPARRFISGPQLYNWIEEEDAGY
jgi:hypothetical protein